MTEHMKLCDVPKFCAEVEKWLKERYGEEEGTKLWEATSRQYNKYLEELPDYGGKKTSHALAIYGSIVIFSLYPLLPDHPPVEELQELVTSLFMSGFVRLGKIFNLNRSLDMRLINKVFQKVGEKDRKQYAQHPAGFCNVSEPYDKKNHAARYHFTQCPNAEFAKKHNARAIHLYEKYGFRKLCTFPHFFKINGEYIDFDLMNLELNPIGTAAHGDLPSRED